MKSAALLALVAGLVLVAGARPDEADDDKSVPLRGKWELASTQDEKHTDPGRDDSRMTVRADGGVVFTVGDRELNSGTFSFAAAGRLRSLDLKLADGTKLLGVYELTGDELVICFEESGKERPAGTAPKGTQWAERWKRVKPRGCADGG